MSEDPQVSGLPIRPGPPGASPSLTCVLTWTPAVMAAAALPSDVAKTPLDGCLVCSGKEGNDLNPLDKRLLCGVFCCCKRYPKTPIAHTQEEIQQMVAEQADDPKNYRQACVHQVLGAADANTKPRYRGRYKSEISYNMRPKPERGNDPYPFMHRDENGNDTTEPSRYWLTRARGARNTPGEVDGGFVPGEGHVRRPDVVIVKDPSRPPTVDNIERVVEMKFPGDRWRGSQREDYTTIGGGRGPKELNVKTCECSEDDKEYEKAERGGRNAALIMLGVAAGLLLLEAGAAIAVEEGVVGGEVAAEGGAVVPKPLPLRPSPPLAPEPVPPAEPLPAPRPAPAPKKLEPVD